MNLGVTGHRAKAGRFPAFRPTDAPWIDAAQFVINQIERHNPARLVAGGATGFDAIASKVAIDFDIPLELALPFEGYSDRWGVKDKLRLEWLIERADEHYYVCDPGYATWKYQVRNERIVERSDHIVALWDGRPSGTKNCLNAARKAGVGFTVHHPMPF